MGEHTPGPWRWDVSTGPSGSDEPKLVGADGVVVCSFGNSEPDHETAGSAPKDADMAMMEATPDLLEACRGLLMCSLPVDVSGRRFVEAARIAIAKATRSTLGR